MKEQMPRHTAETEEQEAARKKEQERAVALNEINDRIEAARKDGFIDNDTANLATAALQLSGDEALFANRVVSRGSDPASLELALTGSISEPVMRAHRRGPGSLNDDERAQWLMLASASLDEDAHADLPPTKKFAQFHKALHWLETAPADEKRRAADNELAK